MDIPLDNKPKRGAKKKTQPSLQFQPPDCVQSEENFIIESENECVENERPAKVQRLDVQELSNQKICVHEKEKRFLLPKRLNKKKLSFKFFLY